MRKFDPTSLPYMAAITTGIMLMRAAVEHFGMWGWVIGPLVGLVASFSLALAGSRISDISSKRKPLAMSALIVMLLLCPAVIYFSDTTPDMGTLLWASFPDFAILLASAVTGSNLLAKPATQVVQVGGQVARKKMKVATKVARKGVKEAEFIAYLQANKKASQQDVADHFGISRQAVGGRIKKLVADGKLKI